MKAIRSSASPGSSASRPSTNARARRRGSTLLKRLPIRVFSSSGTPSHRPGAYAGASGHQTVFTYRHKPGESDGGRPVSSTGTPEVTLYG
jgi:hypothetical protein